MYRRILAVSEEILGPNQPSYIFYEQHLARSQRYLGRPRAALELLQRALKKCENLGDSVPLASTAYFFAEVELDEGDARSARQHLTAAISRIPKNPGEYELLLMSLMRATAAMGDEAAMQMYHDKFLARIEDTPHLRDLLNRELLWAHGRALESLGRRGDAVDAFEKLSSMLAGSTNSDETYLRSRVSLHLGRSRSQRGDYDGASLDLQRALADLERLQPLHGPRHAEVLWALGDLELARGRTDAAVTFLTEAESLYVATAEPDYAPLAHTRFSLARALANAPGSSSSARERARLALEAFRASQRTDDARAVETWMAEHA